MSIRFFSKCPACCGRLHPDKALNCISRYTDAYICNNCGLDETTHGFFWVETAIVLHLAKSSDHPIDRKGTVLQRRGGTSAQLA